MSSLDTTAISRPRPPDLIRGYRLEKLVGKGGMGEVHQAVQLSLGRTVAVKLLNPELAKDAAFVARFEKEAAALAALSHPNIVSIVDKGEDGHHLLPGDGVRRRALAARADALAAADVRGRAADDDARSAGPSTTRTAAASSTAT